MELITAPFSKTHFGGSSSVKGLSFSTALANSTARYESLGKRRKLKEARERVEKYQASMSVEILPSLFAEVPLDLH